MTVWYRKYILFTLFSTQVFLPGFDDFLGVSYTFADVGTFTPRIGLFFRSAHEDVELTLILKYESKNRRSHHCELTQ